jgi:predicted RNase H-like HicB family nuclease
LRSVRWQFEPTEVNAKPPAVKQQEVEMAREFMVVIERDDEGYLVGSVPALKGCHTQSRSIDDLLERMKEAIQSYLEVEGEDATEPLELVGIRRIAV